MKPKVKRSPKWPGVRRAHLKEHDFCIACGIKDKKKLIQLGNRCVDEKEYDYAIKAFELAEDKEKLNSIGDICLKDEHVSKALEAYGLAGNTIMIEFIKTNFSE